MCKPGYSDPSGYPRVRMLDILPWDTDGSPCREAYTGGSEEAWSAFLNDVEECERDENGCYLTSCLIAKYAIYLNRQNALDKTYINCGYPGE